jgi:hypothetical protein
MQVNICFHFAHCMQDAGGGVVSGSAAYRFRIVKVLHNNSFDIAIIILQDSNRS